MVKSVFTICSIIAFPSGFTGVSGQGSVTVNTYDTYAPLGSMKIVCDRTGYNPRLYLEVDANRFTNLSQITSGFDIDIPVPLECPPFKNTYVSYAVGQVHPPFDGRQFNGERPGGYGVPHVDVHFMTVSAEERIQLTQGCSTVQPGPQDSTGQFIQCDYSVMNEGMQKFSNKPPAEYTAGFVEDMSFGGHAIVGHGLHMIPEFDMIGTGTGPAYCESTGPTQSWVDCMTQFMSFVQNPSGGFVEQNCTCGYWDDMTSAILNVFDGKVLGNEVMPAFGIVDLLRSGGLPNPYLEAYPRAVRYDSTGYQPVATLNELVVNGSLFRSGLVLSSAYTTAYVEPVTTCGEIRDAYRTGGCCGNPASAFTFP